MWVTAFLTPKTTYRSIDTYLAEFAKLANTGIPLLLFTDVEFPVPSNVRVLPITLTVPPHVELPLYRNPNKDTAEFLWIQLHKLWCLQEATKYTDDPFLAWIDFSIFHVFRNVEECTQTIQTLAARTDFPTDRILAPGCWKAGNYGLEAVCWRFCGGFLLGHRDLFAPAYARQMALVEAQLPKLSWEVNYWSQMDDAFHMYPADHDDSLLIRHL